jgi:hypothetical protein
MSSGNLHLLLEARTIWKVCDSPWTKALVMPIRFPASSLGALAISYKVAGSPSELIQTGLKTLMKFDEVI